MSNLTGLSFGEKLFVILGGVLLGLLLITLFSALTALIIAWAWNAFMPAVFNLPSITFMQAFALVFLISSLRGLFARTIGKKDS